MNIKEEIKNLEEKERKLRFKRHELEDQILVKESLPKLRKSVGKCFKYMNSYGDGVVWPLYIKIISIDEKDMSFTTLQFQHTSKKSLEVSYEIKSNFRGENYFESGYGRYIEIPLSEFNSARKSALKFLTKLLS